MELTRSNSNDLFNSPIPQTKSIIDFHRRNSEWVKHKEAKKICTKIHLNQLEINENTFHPKIAKKSEEMYQKKMQQLMQEHDGQE